MIKIKLAILESDRAYAEKLIFALNTKYQNELEIYLYDNKDEALHFLYKNSMDVVLANKNIGLSDGDIPDNCAFAYLSESNSIEAIDGKKTVGKYQRIDSFYKDVLSLYSESVEGNISINSDYAEKDIITFFSVSGGSGASSVAVAYAKRQAAKGINILYLNLEEFGDTGLFFSEAGNATLSDIIYAIKSKKTNLSIKIQSALKKDRSNVLFFDSCKLALDYSGITADNLAELISAIQCISNVDKILLDIDFSINEKSLLILQKSNKLVLVDDGTEIGNRKTEKLIQSLNILYEQNKNTAINKIGIFYNKFSSKSGRQIDGVPVLGGAPKYEGFSSHQIILKLSDISDLDKI